MYSMNITEIELPSNKKFGYFFAAVFFLIAAYFYIINSLMLSAIFVSMSLIFLVITFFNDALLLPLNKLWMRFGLLLSIIVSPIIMGIIFFGLFTPMSLIMRLFRRDELRIRLNKNKTHWIFRDFPEGKELSDSFKHQY